MSNLVKDFQRCPNQELEFILVKLKVFLMFLIALIDLYLEMSGTDDICRVLAPLVSLESDSDQSVRESCIAYFNAALQLELLMLLKMAKLAQCCTIQDDFVLLLVKLNLV